MAVFQVVHQREFNATILTGRRDAIALVDKAPFKPRVAARRKDLDNPGYWPVSPLTDPTFSLPVVPFPRSTV